MPKQTGQTQRDEHATIGGVDGKKVFVMDNAANQIVDFVNPTANITVEQGDNPWVSSITDGTNDLYIWGSGGITVIKAVHYRIKESKEWLGSYCWTAVDNAINVYLHIKTGNKTCHGTGSVSSDGKCNISLYGSPSIESDGTDLVEYCMNREVDAIPTTTLFSTPSVAADGTKLECGILGQAGKKTVAGGAIEGAYWLLDHNSDYLIKATNDSGNASDIVIKYQWHEHVAV